MTNDLTSDSPFLRKKTNKGGDETNIGHYKAVCHYCNKEWARGRPAILKAHLANECSLCPENIKIYWRDKLVEYENNYTRRQPSQDLHKTPLMQAKITQHFGSDAPLPSQVNDYIDHLLRTLNLGYVPPCHNTLSGRLLNEEVTCVNKKIESELKAAGGLTLIGSDKFAAIVTDNASNCRVARKKLKKNITIFGIYDNLISDCGKITRFFHNSHQGSAILSQGLKDMKINIEGLQTWCKTRWGSLYITTDSILHARPVFGWINTDLAF
ncbi:hypothetical protein C1645_821380 [Glomus cerebriforme]|uniref:BED-type domain-containing protein n=1 Tax=Glomus cerebriforme TaxID=658196 RepID=A0A397TAA6_9GLOM|nr:hypothetical protein C1645_821380 [Glomus cerebriforme]